jgi:hypothetical protein
MQIDHPAQLIMHTNATNFHGHQCGSLLLHSGGSKGKRHVLKFEHRQGGFEIKIQNQLFQMYGRIDFKYALRSLHRRGFRNIRIVITEQRPGSLVTFSN